MTRLVLVFALVLLPGCISGRGSRRECAGPVTATVRNNWSQPVDVYARIRGTGGHMLGELFPGERREYELPEGATGVYYEYRTATIARPTSTDLTTSYACR